ncbi:MAG TPA: glycosyltransferase family 4 protein [Candidatus Dormibacteraeota bacterium]|nr:glycosyltransferase family 4 protein [Candidatus Dormibacteraeota bacterium]
MTAFKLLFVTNVYPPIRLGGYEEVCFDFAQLLTQRGHKVTVLSSTFRVPEGGLGGDTALRMLRVKSNFRLSKKRRNVFVLLDNLFTEWHNARIVREVIAREGPTFVVVWNGGFLGRHWLTVAERSASVVYYLHDTWLEPAMRPIFRPVRPKEMSLAKWLYDTGLRLVCAPWSGFLADRTIFISRSLQGEYSQRGVNVGRTPVLHNGISDELFPFRAQHIVARTAGEPFRIIYVGRIAAYKGVTTLVRALQKLRALPGLAQARLTLVGALQDEAYERALQELTSQLGLNGAVELSGQLPRSALSEAYAQHDVFAFPSEWNEPFALTLLEAMATGIPIVATLRGGAAEILRDGHNAVTCRAGDATDLSQKLSWLLTHPTAAAAIGERASQQIRQDHTIQAQVSSFESYLQRQRVRQAEFAAISLAAH